MICRLMADTERKLQSLLDRVAVESEKKGLRINTKKTYCMVITKKKENPKCRLQYRGIEIKQATQFKYLGNIFTSDGRSEKTSKQE